MTTSGESDSGMMCHTRGIKESEAELQPREETPLIMSQEYRLHGENPDLRLSLLRNDTASAVLDA
jgi:hypothetical protein